MTYRHSITIPFQDIDAAGIVFFAHLFRYAHETYEHFMSHIDHSLAQILRQGDYLLPLVHAEADYYQPLRLNQAITIELKVSRLGNSAFTLQFDFIDENNRLHASAQTVHAVLDKKTQSKTSIPASLRSALEAHVDEAVN